MEAGRLRRIVSEEVPEAVMLPGGQIWFRHYTISVHAMDRFVERYGKPADEMIPMLHNAFLADLRRARRAGIRRVIRVAETRGGYVLFRDCAYFVIQPDPGTGRHVVVTVLTPRYMGYDNRKLYEQ